MADKTQYLYGIGRRKRSTARARLHKGQGGMVINGQPALEYLDGSEALLWTLHAPLRLTNKTKTYDISLMTEGGGLNGQAEAAALAISNALADLSDDLRSTLKKAGLLKRDPREKERKKYGLKSARKKEQFSKR